MREQFFIDLRRREEAQARRVARRSEPVFSMEDKRISVFEPSDFPERECRSVVRRRSIKDVWRLLCQG